MTVFRIVVTLILLSAINSVSAMALRAFVAMPIEPGGSMLRLMAIQNTANGNTMLMTGFAYGISGKQTMFVSVPYRSSMNNFGNLSVLYRHITVQKFSKGKSWRAGYLAGIEAATDSSGNVWAQAGPVATWSQGRHEIDADLLWIDGLGTSNSRARYDLSWQYRVFPKKRSAWGDDAEWFSVSEIGGRWTQGGELIHQATFGLQRIATRWIIEGGVIHNLTGAAQTSLLISTRIRF